MAGCPLEQIQTDIKKLVGQLDSRVSASGKAKSLAAANALTKINEAIVMKKLLMTETKNDTNTEPTGKIVLKRAKNGRIGKAIGQSVGNTIKIESMESLLDVSQQYHVLTAGNDKYIDHKNHFLEIFKDLDNAGIPFKPFTLAFKLPHELEGQGNAYKDERIDLLSHYKEGGALPIKVALHEYVHIVTAEQLKEYPNLAKRTRAIMKRIERIAPQVVKDNNYAFTNELEFIAEVVSSPRLQAALNAIESDGVKIGFGAVVVKIFKNLLARVNGKKVSTLTDSLEVVVALQAGKDADFKKVHKSAAGKIIVANAGTGKTVAYNEFNNTIDGDDLMVRAVKHLLNREKINYNGKIAPSEFNKIWKAMGKGSTSPVKLAKYEELREEVYSITAEMAEDSAVEGKTVLIASARPAIMEVADIVLYQGDTDTLVNSRKDANRDNPLNMDAKEVETKNASFLKKIGDTPRIDLKPGQFVSDILENGTNTGQTTETKVDPKKAPEDTGDSYELFPGVNTNVDQTNAINAIKEFFDNSKDTSFLLQGRGGTGKTTIINKAISELGFRPDTVVFSAYSNKAVKVLISANSTTNSKKSGHYTTAQLLKLKDVSSTRDPVFKPDPYGTERIVRGVNVVVIDEASMLPKGQQATLEAKAKSVGAKIIYMGDNVQLPPVNEYIDGVLTTEAKVFEDHRKSGNMAELKERMRQKAESPILPITDIVADAVINEKPINTVTFEGKTKLKDNEGVEYVNQIDWKVKTLDSFMEDYNTDPEGTRYIHYNKSSHDKTTTKVEDIRFRLFGDKIDKHENTFLKGEQVILDSGFTVKNPDNPKESVHLTAMTEFTVITSTFTKKAEVKYDQLVKNRGKVERTAIIDTFDVLVRENGTKLEYTIQVPAEPIQPIYDALQKEYGVFQKGFQAAMGKLEYAYIINSHKSQGSSYTNVYVDVGNILGNKSADEDTRLKSLYVATSRPRKKLVLIDAPTKEFPLEGAVNNDEELETATPRKVKGTKKKSTPQNTNKRSLSLLDKIAKATDSGVSLKFIQAVEGKITAKAAKTLADSLIASGDIEYNPNTELYYLKGDSILGSESETRLDEADFNDIRENINNDPHKIIELIRELDVVDTVEISAEHKTRLTEFLYTFVDTSKKYMPDIAIKLNKMAEVNAGAMNVDAKEIYVGTGAQQTSGLDKSSTEILLHEIAHAVSEYARLSKDPGLHATMSRMERLYLQAKKELTWEDFVPQNSAWDPAIDEAKAKEMYDYIFNNKEGNGISEFIAHGLTNEIVSDKLSNVSYYDKETKAPGNFFGNLQFYIGKLIDTVLQTARKEKGVAGDKILMKLTIELAEANNKALRSAEKKSSFLDSVERTADATNDYLSEKFDSAEETGEGKTGKAGRMYKVLTTPHLRDEFLTKGLKLNPSGTAQQIIKNISETTVFGRKVEHLALAAGKLEHNKMDKETRVISMINKGFKKPLSELDNISLGHAVLETDLSSLDLPIAEIGALLSDDKKLHDEIKKLEKGLSTYYANKAEQLGYYIATHKVKGGNFRQNANNIVTLNSKRDKNDKDLIPAIDKLATLQAIYYSSPISKRRAVSLIESDPAGVENMMAYHNRFKKLARESSFDNNGEIDMMIKGYTKDVVDSDTSVIVAPLAQKEEMRREGYILRSKVKGSPLVAGEPVGIYVNTTEALLPYNRAIMHLTSKKAKGTTLTDLHIQESGLETGTAEAKKQIKSVRAKNSRLDEHYRNKRINFEREIEGLMPLINTTGSVLDYRHTMGKSTKAEFMGRDSSASVQLGRMYSANLDKVDSSALNKKAIRFMNDDFEENYNNTDPALWTTIGPGSDDPAIVEMWELLPKDTRNYIKELTGADNITVRSLYKNQYFGYRDMSVANLFSNKKSAIRAVVKMAEFIWKQIVAISKVDIVIKTPAVLIGNIVSNLMLSMQLGIMPNKVAKLQWEGVKALNDYKNKEKELHELNLEKEAGKSVDESRIVELGRLLNDNPVSELIDAGLFTAIMEDINVEETKHKNRAARLFDDKLSKAPAWVRTAGNYAYMTQRTPVFGMMMKATQYSDFVARSSVYTGLIAKGKSKEEAMNIALDAFINYDIPDSPFIKYLNDIGLVMFTKYFERIQRVVKRGVRKNPVQFVASVMGQEVIGLDVDDIYDQNILDKNLLNMVHGPWDHFMNMITPSGAQVVGKYIL